MSLRNVWSTNCEGNTPPCKFPRQPTQTSSPIVNRFTPPPFSLCKQTMVSPLCQTPSINFSVQSTGLPADWEIRVSKTRNLPYYFNRATNESRWEPPEGTDTALLASYLNESTTDNDQPEKIRVRHLLVKHTKSRRPASWKQVRLWSRKY